MGRIGGIMLFGVSTLALSAPTLAYGETLQAEGASEQANLSADTDPNAIVVTARRVEERLQDVPISITVFNQQQLDNRNIVRAGDLATYTPSLSVYNRFGPETTSFSIRGFTQEIQTSPSVAVYFADVVAPRAQGGTTGGNGGGVGSFFDLQNAQVLKGPQGTLFGRNTTGGAVLLVPQKPTSRLEGYVEGTAGSYDLLRAQAVLNAALSSSFRVRLAFDREKRRGYLNNISGVGPKDFADINYWAARASIVGDLTPDLENYTIFSASESDTNGGYPKIFAQDNQSRDTCSAISANALFRQYCPSDLRAAQISATSGKYYDISNGNPTAGQKIRQWQVINTTTWQASDALTIKNIASYAEFRQAQSAQIYGDNPYQNGALPLFVAPNLVPAKGYDNVSQTTFTEEFQIQGRAIADRLKYQAGIYYEMSDPIGFQKTASANGGIICTDIPNLQCANPVSAGGLPANGFVQSSASKYWFRNLGLYAQGTFDLTSRLSLTAGIRYTHDKSSGLGEVLKLRFPVQPTIGSPVGAECVEPASQVTGGTAAQVLADPTRCDFRRSVSSGRPTWLIDLDYKPTDDILIYSKYARGYRQGGTNITNFGFETWGPEKVDTYEIGAKTSWRGTVSGYFNVAAFYNDFKDQQVAINTASCSALPPAAIPAFPLCANIPAANFPSSSQGIANGAKSRIAGVEVDASISPFEGLRADVGYTYLDTKLKFFPTLPIPTGFFQLFPGANVGGPLPLSPKHKIALTGSYTLPLDESLGRLSVSGTFTYQSKMLGSTASIPARQMLPSQQNLNLNLNWDRVAGQPLDIGIFVTNVTNEHFYTYLVGASFGWEAALLSEPRMFGIRAKVHFGD